MSNKELIANMDITASSVRLIFPEHSINEVVSIETAHQLADAHGLDLVQINDQDIPVVKILDLSKHKYDLQLKEKKQAKAQRASKVQVKELQLSIDIQGNDLAVKQKKAIKFLTEKKHVRVVLKLKGRAKSNTDIAAKAIETVEIFIQKLFPFDFAQKVTRSGDTVSCIVKQKETPNEK